MEDIQKLSIDIMDDKVFEPIYTKQYDQGRKVYAFTSFTSFFTSSYSALNLSRRFI